MRVINSSISIKGKRPLHPSQLLLGTLPKELRIITAQENNKLLQDISRLFFTQYFILQGCCFFIVLILRTNNIAKIHTTTLFFARCSVHKTLFFTIQSILFKAWTVLRITWIRKKEQDMGIWDSCSQLTDHEEIAWLLSSKEHRNKSTLLSYHTSARTRKQSIIWDSAISQAPARHTGMPVLKFSTRGAMGWPWPVARPHTVLLSLPLLNRDGREK